MDHNTNAAADGEEAKNNEPVKVVLADDDKDDQEIFKDALTETKIPAEVTTVDNGQELMNHLKDPETPEPEIIFLDINMPVKNGKDTLAEIKKDEELKDIPTVMISTSDNPKDVEDSFNSGANLYVRKPFSFKNFILILKKVFMLKWAGILLKPFKRSFYISENNISEGDLT